MNTCRGSHAPVGGTQGGARWTNHGACPVCGRTVGINKDGHLRIHQPPKDERSKSFTRVGRRWAESDVELMEQIEELLNDDPPYQIVATTAVVDPTRPVGLTRYLILYSQVRS